MTTYRCIHCGLPLGEGSADARREYEERHGVGVCTSPCRWCNEGVRHAWHVCANVQRDGDTKPSRWTRQPSAS